MLDVPYNANFEVFVAVKFQVEIFWVMTPCSVAAGYRRFGRPCFLHLQREDGGSIDIGKGGILPQPIRRPESL